jgi:hypothetical protein
MTVQRRSPDSSLTGRATFSARPTMAGIRITVMAAVAPSSKFRPRDPAAGKKPYCWIFRGADGARPQSTLALDEAGNLYGGAPYSSANCCAAGTVFELSPGSNGWTEHVLHYFGTGDDGAGPNGPLLFDRAGGIYGTTFAGGDAAVGTAFKLSPDDLTEGWTLSSR